MRLYLEIISIALMAMVEGAHRPSVGYYYNWTMMQDRSGSNNSSISAFVLTEIALDPSARSLQPGFYDYLNSSKPSDDATLEHIQQHHGGSQCNQDKVVLDILHKKRDGFYLDLATNHWSTLSNTILLELGYHWHGICFEPNPKYLVDILSNRRCSLVVNPISDVADERIVFRFNDEFSGVVDAELDNKPLGDVGKYAEHRLVTTTLMQTLAHLNVSPEIDYLSLDVEGSESLVLKHFDFSRYRIKVLSVERPRQVLHKLLTKHNYWWLGSLSEFGECIYIHSDLPNFKDVMARYARKRLSVRWAMHVFGPPGEHPYMRHPAYHPI